MFQRIRFFLIFLFLTTTVGISQNTGISVVYTKVKSAVAYLANGDTNNMNVSHKLQFMLHIHDSLAYYEYIKPSKDINNEGFKKVLMFTSFQGPYFFSINKNLIYRKKGKYLLEKPFSDFEWYLTGEHKKINDLNCYKATTEFIKEIYNSKGNSFRFNEPVTAWYTTDVCVPVGPDGFAGLPGLIVKLEMYNEVTILESIKFNEPNKTISLPDYKQKMTEEEFAAHTKLIIDEIDSVQAGDQ